MGCIAWFDVFWCYVVVWLGWCGIRMQAEALLKVLVLVVTSKGIYITYLYLNKYS